MNIPIVYTVSIPHTSPGRITSDRYSINYWLYFTSSWKGLLVICVALVIMWSGRSRTCSGAFTVIVVALIIVDIVSVLYLGLLASNCNAIDQKGNACNHILRCCDPAVNSNSASGCDGFTTCITPIPKYPDILPPVTIDKLPWDESFKFLFWFAISFLVLDVFWLLSIFSMTIGPDPKTSSVSDDVYDVIQAQYEEEEYENGYFRTSDSIGHAIPTFDGVSNQKQPSGMIKRTPIISIDED